MSVGRPPLPKEQLRLKRSIRLAPDIAAWVDERVASRRFKDDTHALEWCVAFLMENAAVWGGLEEFERFVKEGRKVRQMLLDLGVDEDLTPRAAKAAAQPSHASAPRGSSKTESTKRK